MAIDVTLTITDLVENVLSADLIGSGASVDATETFRVKVSPGGAIPPFHKGEVALKFILEEEGSGAAQVQFGGINSDGTARADNLAGDYPPSMLANYGPLTVDLAQADLREIVLRPGQFMTKDGYICGTVIGNDVKFRVVRTPAGF